MKKIMFAYERKQSWQAGMSTKIGDCATLFTDEVVETKDGNLGVFIPEDVARNLQRLQPITKLNCWGSPSTYHISVVGGEKFLQVGWGSNSPSRRVETVYDLLLKGVVTPYSIKEYGKKFSARRGAALMNELFEIFGFEERFILTQHMLDEEKKSAHEVGTILGKEHAQRYRMNEANSIATSIHLQTPWEELPNGGGGNWDIQVDVKVFLD